MRVCDGNAKVSWHLEDRVEHLIDQGFHPQAVLEGIESVLVRLTIQQSTADGRLSGPRRSCGARIWQGERIVLAGLWIAGSVGWSWSEVVGQTEVRVEVDLCGSGRYLREAKRRCGRCRLQGKGAQKVCSYVDADV